jgi:23S rRNA (cytidine2498-2'-O)-methyltransferase
LSPAAPPRVAALATVLAQCREGFETEAAEDLAAIAAAARVAVRVEATPRSGYAVATVTGAEVPSLSAWSRAQAAAPPVFARSVCFGIRVPLATPGATKDDRPAPASGGRLDRVTPLVAAAHVLGVDAATPLFVEHPDTNEGKALSTLARALAPRLVAALAGEAAPRPAVARPDAPVTADVARDTAPGDTPLRTAARTPRLHVFLEDGQHAIAGLADRALDPPWPMGIPRLRVGHDAPSRSARKLVEALVTFLGDDEPEALRPGMRAVDLGAAPGGWSWVLAERGLRVTAVDNGPLKGAAAHEALITHLRVDGLHYRPRRPVDWVTCDIVEAPARIATLMAAWIGEGHARRALFNLKLPMKRRHAEVERCRALIVLGLSRHGVRATLDIRQLYHDREEVTAYLARA